MTLIISVLLSQNEILALHADDNLFCYLLRYDRQDRLRLFSDLYHGPQQIRPDILKGSIVKLFSRRNRLDPRWQSLINDYKKFYNNKKIAEADTRQWASRPARRNYLRHPCTHAPTSRECVAHLLRGDLITRQEEAVTVAPHDIVPTLSLHNLPIYEDRPDSVRIEEASPRSNDNWRSRPLSFRDDATTSDPPDFVYRFSGGVEEDLTALAEYRDFCGRY